VPNIMIVDNGSLSTDVLAGRLENLGAETTIVSLGELMPDAPADGGYDGVVLTGTDVPSTTPYVYDAELELIRRTELPLLGICGGMHLIGKAHGVGIGDCRHAVGKTPVHVDGDEALFESLASPALLFERHRYQLVDVPEGFRRIAWGDHCHTEGIRHAERPTYGLQAHVEFRPEGKVILRNFLSILTGSHPAVATA
jgi:GMP synthase-like glutamine amidotransferase